MIQYLLRTKINIMKITLYLPLTYTVKILSERYLYKTA